MAVDPPHWRTGIGRALISLAFQYLDSDEYNEAIVWTVEGYERGIAFYEAMGVAARRRGPGRGPADTLQAKFGYVELRLTPLNGRPNVLRCLST